MEFTHWRDEIEIFKKDNVMSDKDKSLIHVWDSEEGFCIDVHDDYKLVKKDVSYNKDKSKMIYVLKKKNKLKK